MIHRFVDLFDTRRPIWPFMVTQGSPLNLQSIWLAGGAQTSVRLTQTVAVINGVTFIGDPNLSPDETEVVYGLVEDPSGPTPPRAKVMVAKSDDLAAVTTVVTDPDTPFSSNAFIGPYWHPDGTKIIFVSLPPTIAGDSEIKRVNRDGTGLTSLRTITGGQSPKTTYSPSGDYICYTRREFVVSPVNAQIWVMEDDGTNPTKIHDSTTPLTFGEKDFPAWQRHADVLAWRDPGVGFIRCNADGTSKTTILSDPTNNYAGVCVYSWLSDDSALVSVNLSTTELVLIDGAGGGVTGLGVTGVTFHDVWAAVTSQEQRLYFSRINGGTGARELYSVNESGGDERLEHDQTATSPIAVHHGIYGRNAN